MKSAHDAPEYAASRALADMPALSGDAPLPAPATPRAELLQHEVLSLRDRQRAAAQRVLAECLRAVERGVDDHDRMLYRQNLAGALCMAHALDLIGLHEWDEWDGRAQRASRTGADA